MIRKTGLVLAAVLLVNLNTAGAGVLSLQQALGSAGDHYQPLQLAEEEVGVSKAKAGEAGRALWPNLSVKGEATKGAAIVELGTPGFREASYGVQLSQTLFQGGKLWSTFKQATVNEKIARAKVTKVKQEMGHQVREAYWNLARLYLNANDYDDAIKDCTRYLQMAQKLYHDGTINQKYLLATEVQKNNSFYQKQTTQAEIEKFRWNLAAAMGLEKPEDWTLPEHLPFKKTDIDLNHCLEQATLHNPDYQIQQLSLEASGLENNIKQSQDWPKLELSGFYGRSGGAYNSEDFDLKEDYNISLKLTQNLAWNSLALSGFKQKTSPKLGQSTRTEADTATATLGILDGYKSAAEKKEAQWQLHQARYNREKARQTMVMDVKEAFYNVQKGEAQVANAQLESDLAEKELAIQMIHLRDEKTSIADVAEARNKVAAAHSTLREARVFYLVALSALDKAVGIQDFAAKAR